jgi:hypothetical protein
MDVYKYISKMIHNMRRTFPCVIVALMLVANNYIISAHYSPENFGNDKLVQKKFRCIRYYQDKDDYNKFMDKSCIPYQKDNSIFNDEKALYTHSNILISVFGTMMIMLK